MNEVGTTFFSETVHLLGVAENMSRDHVLMFLYIMFLRILSLRVVSLMANANASVSMHIRPKVC